MIFNMTGGAGLNFKVKAYASELLLPATAAENTIAVITETAISSYVFSADEPEAPDEGMVWFAVGTSSSAEFNALRKNELNIYPLSAKQYVSGAWVDVEAKIHQHGEWMDLEETLLPPTTGWSFTKIFSDANLGNCSFDGDVFVGSYSGNAGSAGIIKSIDFTNYKSIEVYYTIKNEDTDSTASPGYGGVVLLVTDYDLSSNGNEIASKWNDNPDTALGKLSIDTSGITGVHKFVAGIRGYTGTNLNNEIRITKIKGVE